MTPQNEEDFIITSISDDPSVDLAHEITFENTTTRTSIKKGASIRIIEIHDNGLALEMPKRSCSTGHHVTLKIDTYRNKKLLGTLNTTAKVVEMQTDNEDSDRVDVELMQYDEKGWQEFCHTLQSRQEENHEFFYCC